MNPLYTSPPADIIKSSTPLFIKAIVLAEDSNFCHIFMPSDALLQTQVFLK